MVLAPGDMSDQMERLEAMLPDRYELVRPHGRGGMATVYLAHDRKHDRPVAIKVLAPELVSGTGAERFEREIGIAAKLNHPHILPLLDSGMVEGQPYYVMPFIDGESLRDRLAREAQLPIDDAVEIARDVGQALSYAHDRGVVHRDIKPGNILLTEGGAVVADFGIASAFGGAADSQLTRTGQSVGTAGYMSPEQASGDRDVDSRTDQYSLACVLFEMLAGEPPFTGRTARAIVGKQLSQPVPSITALRDAVPSELETAITRALARTPADRFTSTREFTEALRVTGERGAGDGRQAGSRFPSALVGGIVVTGLLAAAVWALPGVIGQRVAPVEPPTADTTRYAIFPFVNNAGDEVDLKEALRLGDALARWNDISIVDEFQLADASERSGEADLRPDAASGVALELGAGRFFMGQTDRVGDSLRVAVALYEAGIGGPSLVDRRALRLPVSFAGADAGFEELVSFLLFKGSPPETSREAAGTRSLPAQQAFEYGLAAVKNWQLTRADSGFSRATEFDPEYARAHLWTALARAWSGADRATWEIPAAQAVLYREKLAQRDAAMAEAVAAQSGGEPTACPLWSDIAENYPSDFAAWYGLAYCLRSDAVVVADPRSPSGWAFRSSRHAAIGAYRRAFELLPSILESFHSDSYASLRGLFMVSVSGTATLLGFGEGDSARFVARPAWREDSLAAVPYPLDPTGRQIQADAFAGVGEADTEAIRRQRLLFRAVAANWVAASPRSPRAREALAYALLMLGETSALDTLRHARDLATTPEDRRDLAAAEAFVELALSLPADISGLERAAFLADSLLDSDSTRSALAPGVGAGLAALVGRVDLAADFARRLPADLSPLAPDAQAASRALLSYASFGGPPDSLARLEGQIYAAITGSLRGDAILAELAYRLALPASLAFPAYRFTSAPALSFDWMIAAQSDLLAGETTGVRASLEAARLSREGLPAWSLTMDTLLPEAILWMQLAEPGAAAETLDPTLSALPQVDVASFLKHEAVASLIRAAGLRAQVARSLGNATEAAGWARAVLSLWRDADPSLGGFVAEMRTISQQ